MYLLEVGRPAEDASKIWRRRAGEETLGQAYTCFFLWLDATLKGRVKIYGGALVGNFVYLLMQYIIFKIQWLP
jgi:hypothetical protein